jgi:hypothetical protein
MDERIDRFSNARKIITPEVFPLCLSAQGKNVPQHGPFLAVNVAGEGGCRAYQVYSSRR